MRLARHHLVAVGEGGPAALPKAELVDARMALDALHPQRGRKPRRARPECGHELADSGVESLPLRARQPAPLPSRAARRLECRRHP